MIGIGIEGMIGIETGMIKGEFKMRKKICLILCLLMTFSVVTSTFAGATPGKPSSQGITQPSPWALEAVDWMQERGASISWRWVDMDYQRPIVRTEAFALFFFVLSYTQPDDWYVYEGLGWTQYPLDWWHYDPVNGGNPEEFYKWLDHPLAEIEYTPGGTPVTVFVPRHIILDGEYIALRDFYSFPDSREDAQPSHLPGGLLRHLGIITGSGGRLYPNNNITRNEIAVTLARVVNYAGVPFSDGPSSFADEDTIPGWAKDGVGGAQRAGILGGRGNNRFVGGGNMTVEEMYLVAYRAIRYIESAR